MGLSKYRNNKVEIWQGLQKSGDLTEFGTNATQIMILGMIFKTKHLRWLIGSYLVSVQLLALVRVAR